ncbi:MAG: hypothetical protein HQL20_06525 [Candidatus Omnitrophica bacterium]|nr:hypothetical protein [Candidatus Omnitrophota bacterium]
MRNPVFAYFGHLLYFRPLFMMSWEANGTFTREDLTYFRTDWKNNLMFADRFANVKYMRKWLDRYRVNYRKKSPEKIAQENEDRRKASLPVMSDWLDEVLDTPDRLKDEVAKCEPIRAFLKAQDPRLHEILDQLETLADPASGSATSVLRFSIKELRAELVQLAGQRKTFSVRFVGGQYELVVYAEPLRLNDDDLGSDRLDRGNAVRSGEDSLWSNVHVYLDIIKKLGLLRGGAKRVLDVGPGDSLMEAESVLNNIPDVSMVEVYEPDLKNILTLVDVLERMAPAERAKIMLVRRSILQLEPGAGPYALVFGEMVLNSEILRDFEIREAWQRIAAVLEPGGVFLGPEPDPSLDIDEQVWDPDKSRYDHNVYVRRGVPPADKAAGASSTGGIDFAGLGVLVAEGGALKLDWPARLPSERLDLKALTPVIMGLLPAEAIPGLLIRQR